MSSRARKTRSILLMEDFHGNIATQKLLIFTSCKRIYVYKALVSVNEVLDINKAATVLTSYKWFLIRQWYLLLTIYKV